MDASQLETEIAPPPAATPAPSAERQKKDQYNAQRKKKRDAAKVQAELEQICRDRVTAALCGRGSVEDRLRTLEADDFTWLAFDAPVGFYKDIHDDVRAELRRRWDNYRLRP